MRDLDWLMGAAIAFLGVELLFARIALTNMIAAHKQMLESMGAMRGVLVDLTRRMVRAERRIKLGEAEDARQS